jgi:uncharacterized membrane-anchored protein YitT (DUF2179 family)
MKLRKEALSELFQITLGIVLASIGLKAFLLPNGFLDGGVTGIAILISRLIEVDISLLLFVFSIPFLILAYYTVSKRILIKSTFSILALSIMIHFENFSIITDDKLLISIFGGLFLGMGIGLSIRNGAVLDGSEVLGVFLNDRYGISIGRIILVFNVILFSLTALTLSVETALYSTLTYLVTAKVIDSMIKGFEDFIGLRVISGQTEAIKEKLVNEMGVGVTLYKGAGGYGKEGEQKEMEIIDTIINRMDIRKIHNIIDEVDHKAFVVEYDVNDIKGGVLRKYLEKSKKRKIGSVQN